MVWKLLVLLRVTMAVSRLGVVRSSLRKEGAVLLHGAKLATFCTGSSMADDNPTIDLVETPVGICNI
jgi:hypothetical protein